MGREEEEERRLQIEKNQAAIRLLDAWSMGDEQEQRETWESLKQALDEDRPSQRKLFTTEEFALPAAAQSPTEESAPPGAAPSPSEEFAPPGACDDAPPTVPT